MPIVFSPKARVSNLWGETCTYSGGGISIAASPSASLLDASVKIIRDLQNNRRPSTSVGNIDDEEQIMANVIAATEPEMVTRLRNVGQLNGPYGDPAKRAQEYALWNQLGPAGARWLIRRAGNSRNLAQAMGIADILAGLGAIAVGPISDALQLNISEELADVLLSALGGIAHEQFEPWTPNISIRLRQFLAHPDDAIRSRAVAATVVLPVARARDLLQDRLQTEIDDDIREAIRAEIQRRA